MKLVIEISDNHMPFVRQQTELHGPEVNLDFPHFMAQLPGKVVGVLEHVELGTAGDDGNLWGIEAVTGP